MIGLNIVPPWAYWLSIGVLTAAVGGQQVRVSNAQGDLAQEKTARATETQQRTQMALDHEVAIGKLQSQHATDQQLKEDDYAKKLATLASADRAHAADAQRLRNRLAAYASGDRLDGETDAAAGQRARDRLPLVGALLAEGVELEAESRAIIQRRDAEVERLLGQVLIDRAACSAN